MITCNFEYIHTDRRTDKQYKNVTYKLVICKTKHIDMLSMIYVLGKVFF